MNVYKTKGTCSREIHYSVKDGVVESIEVIGGCNGNLKGICRLITGMPVEQFHTLNKNQKMFSHIVTF